MQDDEAFERYLKQAPEFKRLESEIKRLEDLILWTAEAANECGLDHIDFDRGYTEAEAIRERRKRG